MNSNIQNFFSKFLGDAKIHSISWVGDDLVFHLIPPSGGLSTDYPVLHFKSVSRLRIDFDYDEYSGEPLVFSATANQINDDRWEVSFEFGAAPEGAISFECADIRTEPSISE